MGDAAGFTVGEVARMVGISASTLRAWERSGLLHSSRTAGGWRRYDAGAVSRARQVQRLRTVDGLAVHAIRRRLPSSTRSPRTPGRVPSRDPASATALGDRLRATRRERGLSLRALATRAGLSPSLVSGVERGLVQPSVASLQRMTAALDTTVSALTATTAPACAVIGARVAPLDLPTPGVRIEDLSGGAQLLEPQRFVVDPGSGSEGEYRHEGEEFIYVLDGALSITLDGHEQFDIGRGMSLCFDSTRSHRWWNPGERTTRVLWINTPRTF